jgi:uncharacterized protein (DUF433 family)
MKGYSFKGKGGASHAMPALWDAEVPLDDVRLEISFRDLVDLRYVGAFLEEGVSLQTVRICIEHARKIIGDERPFSTLRFRTDGKVLFLSLGGDNSDQLLDLKKLQYVMERVVEPSFKDFEYSDGRVVRWRPNSKVPEVVVDPRVAFGQPVVESIGIPTRVLAEAVDAEGDERTVARFYEVPIATVRQAARFEEGLRAA